MKHCHSRSRDDAGRETVARPVAVHPAIASSCAALRREQIAAARRLAAAEAARDPLPSARCRITAARDRRSPFVYRPPRPSW